MIFQNTAQDQPWLLWCPRLFLGASQCILRRPETWNSAFRVQILCINADILPPAKAGEEKCPVLGARIGLRSSSWAWRLVLSIYLLKIRFLDSSRKIDPWIVEFIINFILYPFTINLEQTVSGPYPYFVPKAFRIYCNNFHLLWRVRISENVQQMKLHCEYENSVFLEEFFCSKRQHLQPYG